MKKIFILIVCFSICLISLYGCSSWGDWQIVRQPTCTTEGLLMRVNSKTGESETMPIAPLGHSLKTEVGNPATCTESGVSDYQYCTVCSKVFSERNFLPPTNHSFGDWEEVIKPSCTTAGKKIRYCSKCSETETVETKTSHVFSCGYCFYCGKMQSEGLKFTLLSNNTYSVSKGSCKDDEIVIPNLYNKKEVTEIATEGFATLFNLRKITLGDNIKIIGSSAFSSCSKLKTVIFNSKITTIKRYAFSSCDLSDGLVLPNSVEKVEDSAFSMSDLTRIKLSSNIEELAANSFYMCTKLTEVIIGNNTTKIGSMAFANCSALKSITIPEGVTTISTFCFSNCSNLNNIKLPYSIINIASNSFNNCKTLSTVIYNGSSTEWNNLISTCNIKFYSTSLEVFCTDKTITVTN